VTSHPSLKEKGEKNNGRKDVKCAGGGVERKMKKKSFRVNPE
jgi:hypothetical protein